jgi:hypothetical protein
MKREHVKLGRPDEPRKRERREEISSRRAAAVIQRRAPIAADARFGPLDGSDSAAISQPAE